MGHPIRVLARHNLYTQIVETPSKICKRRKEASKWEYSLEHREPNGAYTYLRTLRVVEDD